MKLKHLIILLVVAAILAVLVFFSKQKDSDELDSEVGQKLFKDLSTEAIRQLVLNGGKDEVTLEIKDGKWTVKGRDGYPANFDNIHSLITKAASLSIVDVKTDVADKYLGKFKLMKPGTGGKDDETGVLVTMKKEDGSVLSALTVGKNPPFSPNVNMTSGGQSQYIKLESSKDRVYVVKDGFDYNINNVTNKDWLNKTDFFKPEKHKSVAVTTNKPEDNWKIFREKEGSDAADLKLAEAKPGEEFDTAKGSTSASAFSSPSFNDVATEADKAKAGLDQPSRTAVIETFDGFTYTVKVGKQVEKPADPNAGASEEFYISVDVVGSFPEAAPEWKPTPEEEKKTEDEKKKLKEEHDKKFADELAKKKERLTKEKALAGKVFIVAKYAIDPLLKNRGEFMKDKPAAPPATPGAATPPAAPGTPAAATPPKREPISATTPPISVEIPPKKPEPAKPGDKKEEPKKDAAKPADPKPAESKPAEVKPTEVRPAGAPPAPPAAPTAPAATPAAPAAPATPAPAPAPAPAEEKK